MSSVSIHWTFHCSCIGWPVAKQPDNGFTVPQPEPQIKEKDRQPVNVPLTLPKVTEKWSSPLSRCGSSHQEMSLGDDPKSSAQREEWQSAQGWTHLHFPPASAHRLTSCCVLLRRNVLLARLDSVYWIHTRNVFPLHGNSAIFDSNYTANVTNQSRKCVWWW